MKKILIFVYFYFSLPLSLYDLWQQSTREEIISFNASVFLTRLFIYRIYRVIIQFSNLSAREAAIVFESQRWMSAQNFHVT